MANRHRMRESLPPNPWHALPKSPPYVLTADQGVIETFNFVAKPEKRYDLSLFPEPFFGSPNAPVILLALNPGWSCNDAKVHSQPSFAEKSRLSLTHSLTPYPFLYLQPGLSTPGALWWKRITNALVLSLGFDRVAKNLLCVQYFPYHSLTFGSASLSVPSQEYSQSLVRAAIARNAEIVVMRSWRLWVAAVPELSSYQNVHHVRNPRNPTLSPKNLGASFNVVAQRLASDD